MKDNKRFFEVTVLSNVTKEKVIFVFSADNILDAISKVQDFHSIEEIVKVEEV